MSINKCEYSGPGRGDCEHFIGPKGYSIPNQHDGPDDTVDAYGKPNGWCWYCWHIKQLDQLRTELAKKDERIEELISQRDAWGVTHQKDVERIKELECQVGCQYCNTPLNATKPVGVYECPECLKNFSNTESVEKILERAEAAEAKNARLLEALERIASYDYWEMSADEFETASQIAQQAIKENK